FLDFHTTIFTFIIQNGGTIYDTSKKRRLQTSSVSIICTGAMCIISVTVAQRHYRTPPFEFATKVRNNLYLPNTENIFCFSDSANKTRSKHL
ncbi:MAG: hypothetical protein J6P99_03240, partial [Paludibacteraceae bacterium]|nr:hypothetical protein [Paludibacteraceae bacterium]